ncbi:MAG: radical SAM protein, partial [Nitrososphaerota archaeon]
MATLVQEREKTEVKEKLVTRTRSICPECYQSLPADVLEIDGKIYIKKTCPKHGEFDELYFGD